MLLKPPHLFSGVLRKCKSETVLRTVESIVIDRFRERKTKNIWCFQKVFQICRSLGIKTFEGCSLAIAGRPRLHGSLFIPETRPTHDSSACRKRACVFHREMGNEEAWCSFSSPLSGPSYFHEWLRPLLYDIPKREWILVMTLPLCSLTLGEVSAFCRH